MVRVFLFELKLAPILIVKLPPTVTAKPLASKTGASVPFPMVKSLKTTIG